MHATVSRFVLFLFLLPCALLAQPDRIAAPIDARRAVVLHGNVNPKAQPRFDQGPVDPAFRVGYVTLMLKKTDAQQAALEQLLQQQQDPASPNYHDWLTPEQYADRFGLSQSDLDKISAWLQSEGFSVEYVARGRNWLVFSGTAGQVRATFHTQIHRYRVDGEMHFAAAAEPSVPAPLEPVVAGFLGLDDFYPKSPKRPWPAFTDSSTGMHSLVPDDLATIYDITKLYQAGFDGTGQKMVIVGQSAINSSDVQGFRSKYNLPSLSLQTILWGADPETTGDMGEADLDLEWAGAVAQNATLIYVYGKGALGAALYAIDDNLAPVISYSFADCEAHVPSLQPSIYRSDAQQANLQGITWLAASGDAGAAMCDQGASIAAQGLAVGFPASIPEVTAVGGTEFNEGSGRYWNTTNGPNGGSAISYIPEVAWNETAVSVLLGGSLFATGGGASSLYPKPAWQAGAGVPNDGARDLPDISLTASLYNDPYYAYSQGILRFDGGTSASTPVFAGIVALLNQYLVAKGVQSRPGVGNINLTLYHLAQSAPNAFHDITVGSNMVPCTPGTPNCAGGQLGYPAGPGYDLATGLGSVDAYNLVTQWPPSIATTTAVTANPTSILTSASTTLTATVTASTGNATPTGSVFFMLGTSLLGTANLSGYSSAASALLRVYGTQLAAGNNSITAYYDGNAGFGVSSGSVTVTVTSSTTSTTTTVTANPTSITVGGSTALTATVKAAIGSVSPAGSVSFMLGSTSLGNASLSGSGGTATASLTVNASQLTAGNNSITASYGGSSNFGASSGSVTVNLTAQVVATTTTVTANPTSIAAGGSTTLTATVKATSASATPTGSVSFTLGSTSLGSANLSGSGGTATAPLTVNANQLAAGNNTITASYGGSTGLGASSGSVTVSLTVLGVATTTTVTANPTSITASGNTVLTATVKAASGSATPTGSVSFTLGSAPLGAANLTGSGGTATALLTVNANQLNAGNNTITASYGGSTGFSASSASVTVNVSVSIYTIIGTVRTASSQGMAGVAITFSNGGPSASTDSNGNYTATVSAGYTGMATPSLNGYTFSPPSRSYSNTAANFVGQDYVGTVQTAAPGAYVIATVAGNGTAGYSGDGGAATSASLNGPDGVAVDTAGNLYVAEYGSNRVRKVSNGVITTVAGNGTQGFSGDNGPATSAQLNTPYGVAVDSAGNLYIADFGNNVIRKVSNGVITTVAGNGTYGFNGDNGPAASAQLALPFSVAVDSTGSFYIADVSSRIRKVSNGVITTVAGSVGYGFSGDNGPATTAQLNDPHGVAMDVVGNLYIGDSGNNRIRKVSSGVITTVAGNGTSGFNGDNDPATSAELNFPKGVAVDSVGNLYISDNNRIRRVSNGMITTVAGNGTAAFGGDNAPAASAQLNQPWGVAVDSSGNVYIADYDNNRIRLLTPVGPPSINAGGIVSAAGSNPGLARGSVASLYGTALADASATAAGVPLPRTLGNVQVSVNGVNAPLWYVSSGQINFQVPFEAPLQGQASVVVTKDGVASSPAAVALTPYAPSIFTYQRAAGVLDPVIVHATTNQLVTPASPAVPGEYLVIYGTGIGDLSVLPATGALSPGNPPASANLTPAITIGGVNTTVMFAGLTPDSIGLAQFNIQVPNNLPSGAVLPLVINFNGAASQPVNLAVQSSKPTANLNLVFTPNPVNQSSDGYWYYGVQLLETSGVGVTLTKLVIGGSDASGSISTFFGSNRIQANGQLTGNVRTPCGSSCTPPYDFTWQFTGIDDNGHTGLTWTGTVHLVAPSASGIGTVVSGLSAYARGLAVDSARNVYYAENNSIKRVSSSGTIAVVAGNGTAGFSGDGGPATSAQLNSPNGVAVDQSGNIYITDYSNARIRKVDTYGTITTFAGNGLYATSGDGGPATSASFQELGNVSVDTQGNVYVVSALTVRRIDKNGIITAVAGDPSCTGGGFRGDGGPAPQACLYAPSGVAGSTSLLYIADGLNDRIRKVDQNGIISTFAGNGSSGFTAAGGPALQVAIGLPEGIAMDPSGNVYFSNCLSPRIGMISSSTMMMTSVAGTGVAGFSGDNGAPNQAELNCPTSMAFGPDGALYVLDSSNQRIRRIVLLQSP